MLKSLSISQDYLSANILGDSNRCEATVQYPNEYSLSILGTNHCGKVFVSQKMCGEIIQESIFPVGQHKSMKKFIKKLIMGEKSLVNA